MNLPIRVRLTAFYAVLIAVIAVALAAFLVLELRADMQARIETDLRNASAQISHAYATDGTDDFLDAAATTLPRSGSAAQVRDGTGRLLLTYGDVAGAEQLLSDRAFRGALAGSSSMATVTVGEARRQRFVVLVTPVRSRPHRQVLVVAESLLEVDEAVHRVLVLLLLAGPAALAASAAGGWWMLRSALRPVAEVTSEAEEIGIHRLHERVPVPRPADEIRHLAETFNAMLDRLQRGVEGQQRLVADASHDLRTPLTVMRSELDVSLRDDALPASARAALESTREEVDRMSRTVDDLLTLAQVDEGGLRLLTSTTDLREVAEAAARSLRSVAGAKGVALTVEGPPCEAQADPQRLHHALSNLIDNAIKFTPPGGSVVVATWGRETEIGVTVTDDGPGIPRDAQAHVFDRFFRADPARGRDAGGSGLGLAICREIATAHGGRLWVDSTEGRGTALSLALPRARAPVLSAPA